jgi:putative inorganic carbon (HCO3(-)) transporter
MESSDQRARIVVGGNHSGLIALCTLIAAIGFTPWIPPGESQWSSWAQFGFRTFGLIALGAVSLAAVRGALSCSAWGVKAAKGAVALLVLTALSAAMSVHRGKSLEAMLNLLAILGLFLAAALLLRGARAFRAVALSQVIAAVPVAALGIVQHFRPDLMPADSSYPGRALGPFGQPNRLGGYLIAAIPVALAFAFAANDRGLRLALLLAVFALALCLVFTYSRGSWIGLVAGLAAFGVLLARWPDLRPQPALLAVAIACLLAPVVFALPAIVSRIAPRAASVSDTSAVAGVPFDPERQGSGSMRRAVWSGAIRATAARPLFGFGPGAFREGFDRSKGATLKRLEAEGGRTADQAHSLYLVLSTERGVLGLAAFVLLAGLILAGGLAALGTGAPVDARLLLAGLIASTVALLAHGVMEDNATFIPQGTSLFAALGLIAAAAPGAKATRRSRSFGALGLATVCAAFALSVLSASAGAASKSPAEAFRIAPWQERHALDAAKASEAAARSGDRAARLRDADRFYRSAIALNPSDPVTRHELARLYLSNADVFSAAGMGGAREAVAQLTLALEQNPYYAEIRNDLGVALLRVGDRAGAEVAFRNAAEGRRDFVEPLLNLAALAVERGDRAEAARRIDQALERNPGSARALAMRAGLASGESR